MRAPWHRGRRGWTTAACVWMVTGMGGCAPAAPGSLLVAAASDLAIALPELVSGFERETGVSVVTTLGSSGQLTRQILEGAPVDVFLSADQGMVAQLERAGRTDANGRAVYALGRLALVTGSRRPARLGAVEALADDAVGRIAIAHPEHAPYGRAARQALETAGVLEAVEDRLVIVENVRQALQLAVTGNVDAALAGTGLMTEGLAWVPVPESLHEPLVQEGAVILGGPRESAARDFLRFVTGPRGREILERHGFRLPTEGP